MVTIKTEAQSLADIPMTLEGLQLKENLLAGFNVGLLSLPVSMVFAKAGGVSPALGITAAFWAGFFPLFGDSRYSVIAPSMSTNLMAKNLIK